MPAFGPSMRTRIPWIARTTVSVNVSTIPANKIKNATEPARNCRRWQCCPGNLGQAKKPAKAPWADSQAGREAARDERCRLRDFGPKPCYQPLSLLEGTWRGGKGFKHGLNSASLTLARPRGPANRAIRSTKRRCSCISELFCIGSLIANRTQILQATFAGQPRPDADKRATVPAGSCNSCDKNSAEATRPVAQASARRIVRYASGRRSSASVILFA